MRVRRLLMRGPVAFSMVLGLLPGSAGVALRGDIKRNLTDSTHLGANSTHLVTNSTHNDSVALVSAVEQRLAFLHIPKNGGTAIEDAAQAKGVRWGGRRSELFNNLKMPDGNLCSGYHVPLGLLEKSYKDTADAAFKGKDVFCVTRDPAQRAVSEYKYLLDMPWGKTYDESQHTGLRHFPECSKEGLNHFLQNTLKIINGGERYIDDCHQLPQANFIWDDSGRQVCHYILRQDDLTNSFNNLMEQYGSDIRLPKHHHHSSNSKCPDISVEDLDERTAELLKEVYAEDYRLLGYTPPK